MFIDIAINCLKPAILEYVSSNMCILADKLYTTCTDQTYVLNPKKRFVLHLYLY